MMRKVLAGWLLLAIACHAADKKQPAYATVQEFRLTQKQNGTDGKIELLMDARLTPAVREQMWGKGEWSQVLSPETALFKEFKASPPRKAKLRIKNEAGRVVAERSLDRPLAELKECAAGGCGGAEYFLTVDFTAGFGSYSGLGTTLLQISKGTLQDAKAIHVSTHRQEPIRLAKTLKSDWRIATGNQGTEILALSSHPGSDGAFVTEYVRYRFDGGQWLKYERHEVGMWESDQPFPPRSAFP